MSSCRRCEGLNHLALFVFIWNNLFMTAGEFRSALTAVGVTQADFGRLVDVTPRAISLWLAGERAIPGSVEAYMRLLRSLPVHLRQVELARLDDRKSPMREGMYAIAFRSSGSDGFSEGTGTLILENNRVYGADPWGGRYDGGYVLNQETRKADIQLKITFPPNRPAVFGIVNPYEWAVDASTSIDTSLDSGIAQIVTSIGPKIEAEYRYLRPIPEV